MRIICNRNGVLVSFRVQGHDEVVSSGVKVKIWLADLADEFVISCSSVHAARHAFELLSRGMAHNYEIMDVRPYQEPHEEV